jgi:hypothetical protein
MRIDGVPGDISRKVSALGPIGTRKEKMTHADAAKTKSKKRRFTHSNPKLDSCSQFYDAVFFPVRNAGLWSIFPSPQAALQV